MTNTDPKKTENIAPQVEELNDADLDQVQGGSYNKSSPDFGKNYSNNITINHKGDDGLKSMDDGGVSKMAESDKRKG